MRALRHQARGGLSHHQGLVQPAGAGRFGALGRRKPGAARPAVGRSAHDPLAQRANPAGAIDRRAVQGQKSRPCQAYRRRQFQRRHDRRGATRRRASRWRRCRSKPIPISTRRKSSPRRAATAWRWSAIARWRAARCRATRCCNASAAPTANPPAQVALRYLEQQNIIPIPRTSKRERLAENLGSLEFDADRRRDGGDRRAQAAGRAHRQSRRRRRNGIKPDA